MPDYEITYQLKEPASRNQQTGNFKYRNSGFGTKKITVTAANAAEARKKTAKHPSVLKSKENLNKSIDDNVKNAGGKARHKIEEIKPKPKLRGQGGGGTMTLYKVQDRTGLSGPLRRKMSKGGLARKKKRK